MGVVSRRAEDEGMTENSPYAGPAGAEGAPPAPEPPRSEPPPSGPPRSEPPPAGPPPSFPSPRPPLRRSRTDRKVAGVAGGLGRYTDIDPLVFRVVFVVLAIFGGSGILLYALGWLLIPEEGEDQSEVEHLLAGRASSRVVGAILLAIVGVAAVGQLFGTGFGHGGVLALAAIAVAALLISRSGHPRGPAGPAPWGPQPPEAPGAYGQTAGTAYTSAGVAAGEGTGPPPAPPYGPAPGPPYAPTPYGGPTSYGGPTPPPVPPYGPPPGTPYGPPPPPPPPAPPRERSVLGRLTVSAALLVTGALVAWNAATSDDLSATAVLAAALVVVGGGLLVGALVGRARGLVAVGVVLLVVTTVTAVADVHVDHSAGDRRWEPATVAEVDSPYRLGAGDATLDLRDVAVPPGGTLRVEASVGVGQLEVIVPDDVALDVEASARVGNVDLPEGHRTDGLDVDETYAAPGAPSAGLLELDLSVGVGDVEVRRATS